MNKIVLTGKGTDLAVLESLTPADLFAPGGTEPVFEAISKEVSTFVADVTTESGRKEIASMAYKIAQSKNFLDKVGKIFNSDLKEKTKAVDKERATVWDKLEALQAKVSAPLDAYKAAEDTRVQGHKDAMAELERLTSFAGVPTLEQIFAAQHKLVELRVRDWQEFVEMTTPIFEEQTRILGEQKTAADQRAADQAELEALRAAKAEQEAKDQQAAREKADKERIDLLTKQASERAQREAEAAIQAEKDKAAKAAADAAAALQAAEDKAAKDKTDADARAKASDDARIAAEARSKLEAEQAVLRERERAAEEKAEQDRQAKLREADRAHRGKINNEAMEVLLSLLISDDIEHATEADRIGAKHIIECIVRGEIPHVSIAY